VNFYTVESTILEGLYIFIIFLLYMAILMPEERFVKIEYTVESTILEGLYIFIIFLL